MCIQFNLLPVLVILCRFMKNGTVYTTVLPAKGDSDVLFVYEVIRVLESIDHLCINPIHRLGLMHK